MNPTSALSGGAMSTALRHMSGGFDRLNKTAKKISMGKGDLAGNLVDLRSAQTQTQLGAAVAKTHMRAQKSLIDVCR